MPSLRRLPIHVLPPVLIHPNENLTQILNVLHLPILIPITGRPPVRHHPRRLIKHRLPRPLRAPLPQKLHRALRRQKEMAEVPGLLSHLRDYGGRSA